MAKPFSKIRSAAIDGRLQNPVYRKIQLKNLNDTLSQSLNELQRVIAKDTGHSPAEVKLECWLALRCISEAYAAIDPAKALQDEYTIASGRDASDVREPVGIVVIEPTTHTFFYSLICALVPALAAGNCILIQVEQSMLETSNFVLKLIQDALDNDIIQISRKKVNTAEIDHRHAKVFQNGSPETTHLANEVVSRPNALVAAIIERDANIQEAAKALVMMRFSLRGKSPYAPDVVLVNEWVKKEFLVAVTQHSIRFMSDAGESRTNSRKLEGQGLLDEIVKEGFANVISAGHEGIILDIGNRKSFLTQRKLRERCFGVLAVTSMDDAIDVSKRLGRLAAAYVFTSPNAAKYICQFIDSDTSFVNHVPANLLFGPVAPANETLDYAEGSRYPRALFTVPKPQYITKPALISRVEAVLTGEASQQLHKLDAEATIALPEMKRAERANGIGFFQQGIVTGGIVFLTAIVSATGGLCYCLVKYAWPVAWRAL